MAKAVQALVLDVDGTLVDSERDGHRVAFNRAFVELGLAYHWDPDLYGELLRITGGERRLAAYLEGQGVGEPDRGDLARRLHRRKTELFQQLIEDGAVQPRPGVPELLDALSAEGIRLSVATTGRRAWVEPLLERLFGIDRFEVVVTGDEAAVLKPDPAAHALVLDALGLSPGDGVVALEDSRNGLLAAKAADLPCVVVTNDYTRGENFSEADLVVDGFGVPDAAVVLHDPHAAASNGRLDVATFQRVAAVARC